MKHRNTHLGGRVPLLLASILSLASSQAAVTFVNPGLDGTPSYGNAPTGWSGIPNGTSWSTATSVDGSAPILMALTGGHAATGYYGTPHSGTTFAGGIYGTISGNQYQQGIQQTVGGFTVGEQYSFSFYQSVPKYNSGLDDTGSWKVFANGTLIATTVPTTDTVAWNEPGKPLIWEQRTVTFTATAETITLGFLSFDPDGSFATAAERVVVGIDSFSDITPVPEPSAAALGVVGALGLLRRRRA